jgi:hypothetical protein
MRLRALHDHTYAQRAEQVHAILKRHTAGVAA